MAVKFKKFNVKKKQEKIANDLIRSAEYNTKT